MKQKDPNTEFFEFYNANPKDRNTGDCVVRACSLAVDRDWDAVLDIFVELAHKNKRSPFCRENIDLFFENCGFTKQKQIRHADNSRIRGEEFIQELAEKNITCPVVIASVGWHHITALKRQPNGSYKFYDTWNPTAETVGNYWVK